MFSVDDIAKIGQLASLELTDEEKKTFAHQFEEILEYFKVIDGVTVPEKLGDDPTQKAPHVREDIALDSGVGPEDFSPHLEDGHFKVPKVIE